jgi:hypothetical protein
MDAPTFNRRLDQKLAKTGAVDEAVFIQLRDAYTYQAATTVKWVEAKLTILAKHLSSGSQLQLYEPAEKSQHSVASKEQFAVWVQRHFPGVSLKL